MWKCRRNVIFEKSKLWEQREAASVYYNDNCQVKMDCGKNEYQTPGGSSATQLAVSVPRCPAEQTWPCCTAVVTWLSIIIYCRKDNLNAESKCFLFYWSRPDLINLQIYIFPCNCNTVTTYSFWFCWQGALRPDRKAFWAASALCSWTASVWTWRRGQRSPQGSNLDARATAAPMAHSVRTKATVLREPTVFPVTAATQPTLDRSVMKVHMFICTPRVSYSFKYAIFYSYDCPKNQTPCGWFHMDSSTIPRYSVWQREGGGLLFLHLIAKPSHHSCEPC